MSAVFTPVELAERWKCSTDVIYKEIHAGRLIAQWIGGWKIDEEEATRFKAAQTFQPMIRRRPGPKKKLRHLTKG